MLRQKRCSAQHKETSVSKQKCSKYNFLGDFIRPQFQHLFLKLKKKQQPLDVVMFFVFFAEKCIRDGHTRVAQKQAERHLIPAPRLLRDGVPACGHLRALTRTHTPIRQEWCLN